jgi:hypothetical protein
MAPRRRHAPDLRDSPDDLARFGWLLGLIGSSVVFSMAAPDAVWGESVALLLQAGVLLLALNAVQAPPRLRRLAVGAVAAVIAIGAAGLLVDTSTPEEVTAGAAVVAGLGVVLVAATIAAIADHLRTAGALTGRTVLGALCIYLLIGTLFTFAYALLATVDANPFFADGEAANLSSLEYFSFTTQTTVGFGDLAPATRAGRALAMAQALIGQIYLVTVVALVVSNLTLPRRHRSPTDSPGAAGPDDE